MWVSGRFTVCPKCGADAPAQSREWWDPQSGVWTGEQQCRECATRLLYTRRAETEEERHMAKRAKDGYPKKLNGGAPKRPRAKPLPGLEDVRIGGLDDICASVSEIREQMNLLRTDEGEQLRTALGLMRKHNKTTWRAAGVELARVPGEEKLRVRTTKEKATAETEDEADVEAREAEA